MKCRPGRTFPVFSVRSVRDWQGCSGNQCGLELVCRIGSVRYEKFPMNCWDNHDYWYHSGSETEEHKVDIVITHVFNRIYNLFCKRTIYWCDHRIHSISNKSPNVKNKKIGQEIAYKYEISLADIFRKYNRNMFCRIKKELWFKKICYKEHINDWKSLL